MANGDVRLDIDLNKAKKQNDGLYARPSYSKLLAREDRKGRFTQQFATYSQRYVSKLHMSRHHEM